MTNKTTHTIHVPVGERAAITRMTLAFQGLREIPQEVLAFPNLEVLDISHNHISAIPEALAQLPGLRMLIASHNRITDVPFLPHLEYLELNHNRITIVPPSLYQMPLKALNLAANRIEDFRPKTKIKTQSLVSLNLEDNQITSLHGFIHYYKNLEVLKLDFNQIGSIPKGIKNLSKIKTLMLNYNRIRKISSQIGSCKHLTHLSLIGNKIRRLPEELAQATQLHRLDLSGNNISEFPAFLGRLPVLLSLRMTDNKLSKIDIRSGFTILSELNVNRNKITSFTALPNRLSNLRTLLLAHNKLRCLSGDFVFGLKKLTLNNNPISDFPPEGNGQFQRLYELNIARTGIKNLPGSFPELQLLTISRTPYKPTSLQLITYFPMLKVLDGKLPYDKDKTLRFLAQCRQFGIKRKERILLFKPTRAGAAQWSYTTLYHALALGNKSAAYAYAHILKSLSIPFVKNPFGRNSRLLIIGKTRFNYPVFKGKIEEEGIRIIDDLQQQPSHILLGEALDEVAFTAALQYAEMAKLSFLNQRDFFKKFLVERSNKWTKRMADNLERLLRNDEIQNQLLGLKMALSVDVSKEKSIIEAIERLESNGESREVQKLAEDILFLNQEKT